jgi:hypothetical protein
LTATKERAGTPGDSRNAGNTSVRDIIKRAGSNSRDSRDVNSSKNDKSRRAGSRARENYRTSGFRKHRQQQYPRTGKEKPLEGI